MPSQDPSDDFSQLPTADGVASGSRAHGVPPVKRQQTRIGPRSVAPEEPAPTHHESDPPSDDWNELFQNTPPAESHAEVWAEWSEQAPLEPPPPPVPRRTVIGRRSPAPEDSTSAPSDNIESPVEKPSPPASEPEVEARLEKSDPSLSPQPQAEDSPPSKPKPKLEKSTEDVVQAPPSTEKPATSEKSPSSDASHPANPPSIARKHWEKWGGKALSLSVAIHALLLLGGGMFVVSRVMEPKVDFLPGGGTKQGAAASQELEHQIQQKKSPWLKKAMPVRKIAAVGSISDIVLPDDVPDLMELPASNDFLSSSKLTAGMGLAGAGGGFGKSMGLGSRSGMVFQPFSMFGMEIKAKRLALVLDVSTSMAPHLPRVIEEVDKVAKGSVVVLYFGCGLEPPPPRGLEGDGVYSTNSVEFEKFWRLGGATLEETRKFRIDPKKEIQNEAIYRILSKRPQTYFIHNTGLGYTWLALLCDQVRSADGIYWFSDFQDRVDFKQVHIVRENMERRKQRLYMHAYMRGGFYDLVRTQLVEPTKGDVKLEE